MSDINTRLQIISQTKIKDAQAVKKAALELENLIFNLPGSDKFITDLSNQEKLLSKLQLLYEKFETNLEREYSSQVLKNISKNTREYLLYKRFVTLIKNEINLADIKKLIKFYLLEVDHFLLVQFF